MKTKTILKGLPVIVKGYPFVSHVEQKVVEGAFDLGLIFDPKGYHSNQSNAMGYGVVRVMGYKYDLRAYLKKYIIKTDWGIQEYYAPNKTTLRKLMHTKVHYIIELKGA